MDSPMKPTVSPAPGGVDQPRAQDVQDRVDCLQQLATRMVSQYLTLAETLFVEHQAGLWQRARAASGDVCPSEEDFWEYALGIKRRTGFQLVAVGRMLSTLRLPTTDRTALSAVGLHKMDVLVPILSRQTTVDGAREWIALAQTLRRDDLRDAVRLALGRSGSRMAPGDRLQRYLVSAMPDLSTRELAIEFFAVGASMVESENGLAIVIAGMQEALSTWQAHVADTDGLRIDPEASSGS